MAIIDRRSLLRAALFVAAAPIIVRASSLMPVRAFAAPALSADEWFIWHLRQAVDVTRRAIETNLMTPQFAGIAWDELPRL